MAGKPFDREVWNNLEKALSSDWNQEATNADLALRELLLRSLSPRLSANVDDDAGAAPSGFIGDGFKVRPTNPATMVLPITPGLGFLDAPGDEPSNIGSNINVNDPHQTKPVSLTTQPTFTVPAPAGSIRYDLIEVSYSRFLTDAANRDVLDPGTGIFAPSNVKKTLSWNLNGLVAQGVGAASAAIYYKIGVAGLGVPPAVDTGYVAIAVVQVDPSVTSIDADKIRDLRRMVVPGGVARVSGVLMMKLAAESPSSAQNQIGLFNVVAPPGIKVGALAIADNAALYTQYGARLFFFCGATPRGINLSMVDAIKDPGVSLHDNRISVWPEGGTFSSFAPFGPLASADQALLGGGTAGTTPGVLTTTPLKVAVDQPCAVIDVGGFQAVVQSVISGQSRSLMQFTADILL